MAIYPFSFRHFMVTLLSIELKAFLTSSKIRRHMFLDFQNLFISSTFVVTTIAYSVDIP